MSATAELVAKFLTAIDGEPFFSTGKPGSDYSMIKSALKRQGYWAGNAYRYFFDDDFNLIKVEERRFGA